MQSIRKLDKTEGEWNDNKPLALCQETFHHPEPRSVSISGHLKTWYLKPRNSFALIFTFHRKIRKGKSMMKLEAGVEWWKTRQVESLTLNISQVFVQFYFVTNNLQNKQLAYCPIIFSSTFSRFKLKFISEFSSTKTLWNKWKYRRF